MTPAHEMAILLGVIGVLFVVAAAVRWLQGYREHERLEEEWSWPSEEEELLALVRTEYVEGRIDAREMEAATEHVLNGGLGCKRFPFLPMFPLPQRPEPDETNRRRKGVVSGDHVPMMLAPEDRRYLEGVTPPKDDQLMPGVEASAALKAFFYGQRQACEGMSMKGERR